MIEMKTVYTKNGPNGANPLDGATGYEIAVDDSPVKVKFIRGDITSPGRTQFSLMPRTVAETLRARGELIIVEDKPSLKKVGA